MHFLSPIWLLLLLAVAAILAVYMVLQLRRTRYVARFSNVALLGSVVPRRPGWRRHLTFALLLIAMTVLSLGVARPSAAVRVPRERATVIMAIDVSLSMQATDVLPTRIQAAKAAAKQFTTQLPARINLGLLSFARDATMVVSPTQNRAAVRAGIDTLHLEDYTAIGRAILTSLNAIKVFGRTATQHDLKPPPGRIVLLSDGSNTVGPSLETAIAAARKAKVPVSTIAFGTPGGTVTINGQTEPVPADTAALSEIAHATGGSFNTAASKQQLEQVYKNIGSQIGYTTVHRDISWRYLTVGVLVLLLAGASSMLWSGRLT